MKKQKQTTTNKKSKSNRQKRWKTPVIFSLLLGTTSIVALLKLPNISLHLIYTLVVKPLIRIFSIMTITLIGSAIVEGLGWASFVSRFSRPLMKIGNLSDYAGVSFTTAFLSGLAGNTMLYNFYKEKKIDEKELTISVITNHGLPSFFLHLPTTAAIIIPLAGVAGIRYLFLVFCAAVIRTFSVLFLGRFILPKRNKEDHKIEDKSKSNYGWQKVKVLLRRYLKIRLVRIALFTIPIYILVAALRLWGVFTWLEHTTSHLISNSVLPVQGISVIVFTLIADFTAGAAAAGAMLQSGALTIKATVLALLIGNLLATPIRALRHQLPNYLGVFGPKLGAKLLALSQTARITSVLLVTIVYYFYNW